MQRNTTSNFLLFTFNLSSSTLNVLIVHHKLSCFFIIAVLGLMLLSCNTDNNKRKHKAFELLLDNASKNIKHGEDISFHIRFTSEEHAEIKHLKLFIDNKFFQKIPKSNHLRLSTDSLTLGKHNIQLKIEYEGVGSFSASRQINILSDIIPLQKTYSVIHEYPHDYNAYTQGLEFTNAETLYESTGQYGISDIRKINLKTGKVEKKTPLDKQYFGEGMTVLFDEIYQLTWREMTCFVYDKKSLQRIKRLSYQKEIQGWGLCNNGQQLIMSDGTASIYFLNPSSFRIERKIVVCDHNGEIEKINELEYTNGKIYANVYTKDFIIEIDPKTGKVIARIDLKGILKQKDMRENTDVLNGIAYHKERKSFFVTGKNWSKLFEVVFIDDKP